MSILPVIWFFLIGILLTVYAILDGFDLGVGFWYLFAKKEENRRTFLNAIGPIWDGNEVWLLTGGGALFAAFPIVYATVFSGFYLALMLVLWALIFRAVAIEFRSKSQSAIWRKTWDAAFAIGSIVPGLLFGVAIGNILRGLPLDANGDYAGTFFDLLNPYALLIGLLGLSMFAVHGAQFIILKTQGDLAEKARKWAKNAWVIYVGLFCLASIATVILEHHLFVNFILFPFLLIVPILSAASMALIFYFNKKGFAKAAFAASSSSIAGLMALTGTGIFPNLVPALDSAGAGLNVFNASSSPKTLGIMLVIACIGMPFVIAYTIWIYRIFRGKVTAQGWY